MRHRLSFFLVAACLLALSVPVWAASTLSTRMWFGHETKLLNLSLKPGHYRFVANESNGRVKVENKYLRVIAHVKGRWVKLGNKSQYSEVLMNHHTIQEIRFAGKKEAVKFTS